MTASFESRRVAFRKSSQYISTLPYGYIGFIKDPSALISKTICLMATGVSFALGLVVCIKRAVPASFYGLP